MTDTHELKVLPEYYKEVSRGTKKFELRKDDRDYKVGDWLRLREFRDGEYTRNEYNCKIRYLLRDAEQYGLKKGFVILSLS